MHAQLRGCLDHVLRWCGVNESLHPGAVPNLCPAVVSRADFVCQAEGKAGVDVRHVQLVAVACYWNAVFVGSYCAEEDAHSLAKGFV